MYKEFILKIQNKVLKLIPVKSNIPLSLLLEDCCSELSRLVANWIREQDRSCRLLILKGDNVCDTKKSHDIVAIINLDKEVNIIDPTIWQFFPEKQSILVFIKQSIGEAPKEIEKLYGGQWEISEEFSQLSTTDKIEYQNII